MNPSKPNPFHRLGQAIGLQPGEGEPFLLLLGQSFFLGITLIAYYAASNALFLTRFSSENLPYVYLVAAGVIILTGLGFYRLQTLIPFPVLLLGNFCFLLAGTIGLRILLETSGSDAVYFSVLVWLRLLWVLGNLGLWTLANRLFTLRQGKRLFSLILAGGVLAIILTGFLNSILIEWLGTANLLWISASSLSLALGLLAVSLRRFNQVIHSHPISATPESQPQNSTQLFKNPYLWFIFLYTTFSTIGTYVLDYAFIGQADIHLSGEQLGKFFGGYLGASTLVTLLFLLFLTNRILRRFGVRGGLLVDPLAVGLGTIIAVLVSQFSGAGLVIFWIIVATKLFDDVTVSATTNTSVRLMYQPLPITQRTQAQTFVESVISPLSMGLSGGLILLFRVTFHLTSLQAIYLLLFVFIGWLAMGILLGNQYIGALQKALRRRYLTGNEENIFVDETSLCTLETYLTSPHPGDVLMALTLLAEHRPETLQHTLPDLLHHPAESVRLAALEHLDLTQTASRATLEQLIHDQTQTPHLIGLALQRMGNAACLPYLDHPNLEIRMGALVSGLKSGLDAAHSKLIVALQGNDTSRAFSAEVMGRVDTNKYATELLKLMEDEAVCVRKAALRAAAQGDDPDLWQGVVNTLADKETRSESIATFVSGGNRALPALTNALRETSSVPILRVLIRVCGQIGGESVPSMLWPLVTHSQAQVRGDVLHQLTRHRFQTENLSGLQIEITYLEKWAGVYQLLPHPQTSEEEFLHESLSYVLMQTRSRVLDWAMLRIPLVERGQLRQSLMASDEQGANALEMLDVRLGREKMRSLLLAIAGASATKDVVHQILKQTSSAPQDLPSIMASCFGENNEEGWVAACWLYAEQKRASLPAEIIAQAAQAKNVFVREVMHNPHQGDRTMLTIEKTLILKSASIFSETPAEVLAELAQYLDEVEIETGKTIFEKGDPGNSMYIIVSGKVQVHDGERTLNELGDREVFGEMALLDPAPRMASVTALEPTLLLRLGQEPFYEVVDARTEIARGVIRVLSRYLREKVQDVGRLDEELKAMRAKV